MIKKPILFPEPKPKKPKEETYGIGNDMLDYLIGVEPAKFKSYLKQHGEDKITKLTIYREPVSKGVNMLMDVISLGKYSEVKKKLPYDDFFHLGLIINGTHIIEKNEVANVRSYTKSPKEELMSVKLTKSLTINEFIENASKGRERAFWREYNALSTNCQHWVSTLLSKSGLLNPHYSSFIYQDLGKLVESMPSFSKTIATNLTDAGSAVNRLIQWISGGRLSLAIGSGDVGDVKTTRHVNHFNSIRYKRRRFR